MMNHNGQQVKKWYHNGVKVFAGGRIVTYMVDKNVSYDEEVDYGKSCLTPKTFTPTKNGWVFVGWREDNTASSSVLTSKIMEQTPITLFAVFKREVTVTYYPTLNSATAKTESDFRYYNNGNVVDPSFTLWQTAVGGWTARGWASNTAGNASIAYNNGATFTRDSSITLYSCYQQTITVTYYNGTGTAANTTGTRYVSTYNKATYVNPSFTLSQAAKSGWSARGWSTSNMGNAAITYDNGKAFTRDSNVTLYGCYQQTITVTYYNNSTSPSTTTGTRYFNSYNNGTYVDPSFTLSQAASSGWTGRGWSTTNAGNASITYENGKAFTRDSNVTLYGCYQQTITLSYSGNGATSGSVAADSKYRYWAPAGYINPSFSIKSNGFTRTGYTFNNWALGSTSGTQYSAGATVTLTASTTAYALWTAVAFTWIQNGVAASGYTLKLSQNGAGQYSDTNFDGLTSVANLVVTPNDASDGYGKNPVVQCYTNYINTGGATKMTVSVGNCSGEYNSIFLNDAGGEEWVVNYSGHTSHTFTVTPNANVRLMIQVGTYAQSGQAEMAITTVKFHT